ncbi:MAG TPA: hypothetical protein VK890_05200 [Bacteroidia bacterium]|jgi:hypothetical protein|nr:hypothetical protein [Bacteroidia bacterium]
MKNKTGFSIALLFCMLFSTMHSNAQYRKHRYYNYSRYSTGKYGNSYNKYSYNLYNYHGWYFRNDCLNYYYGYDTNRAKFKAVTETEYMCDDSTLANRKMETKERTTFNKIGQKLGYIKIDTIGTMDSDIYVYDAHYYKTRETNYKRDNLNHMVKVKDEIWVNNARGFSLKDSSWSYGSRYGSQYPVVGAKTKIQINASYSIYDTANNELQNTTIDDGDTTIVYNKYGKFGKIYSETHEQAGVSKEEIGYDAQGNVISRISKNVLDTTANYYAYNDKGWLLSSSESSGKNVVEVTHMNYDKPDTYTKIYDETPVSDGISCPNNSRTVSVYDTADNLLSEIVTSEKSGKPFVTTTIHTYVRKNGHIVIDTTSNTEEGYLYSLSSTQVKTWKFDAHGNELETTDEGGGEYSQSGKTTSKYNPQDNIIQYDKYNSCNADKPESSIFYTYYKGGKNMKEIQTGGSSYNTRTQYAEDGRKMQIISNGWRSTVTVFVYEK